MSHAIAILNTYASALNLIAPSVSGWSLIRPEHKPQLLGPAALATVLSTSQETGGSLIVPSWVMVDVLSRSRSDGQSSALKNTTLTLTLTLGIRDIRDGIDQDPLGHLIQRLIDDVESAIYGAQWPRSHDAESRPQVGEIPITPRGELSYDTAAMTITHNYLTEA